MLEKIQDNLYSLLSKLGSIKVLVAIREGVVLTTPFTIIGSVFLIIRSFPNDAWAAIIAPYSASLTAVVNVTFGIVGLVSTIGIGYNMAKLVDIEPISNAAITLVAFLLATLTPELGINVAQFGAVGMFTGIVVAILTTYLCKFFIANNIVIRMPEGVPPAISNSFISLIPGAVVVTIVWIIRVLMGIEINVIVQALFSPLAYGMKTLPGFILFSFAISILWFGGIHGGSVLGGISSPIFLAAITENMLAFSNGEPIPHIINGIFWINFICVGGAGATLGLVMAMLRSKSKMYRDLGRLALPSAIFCINEPVIFGTPIVLNPIMLIPFILAPIALIIGTYALMSFGIIGKVVFQVPWTMPTILGPYLATNGDIGAAIWSVCSIFITYLIYLPFFKIQEKIQLQKEEESKE